MKCVMSYFTQIVHNVYLNTILDVTPCSLVDIFTVTHWEPRIWMSYLEYFQCDI
jgi:hypothetical protein